MFILKNKKKVYSIREFLAAPQQAEITRAHPIKIYGIAGIDITHSTFFSPHFAEPFFVVFSVFAVAALSIAAEYYFRSTGNEVIADGIDTTMKFLFPTAFYLFLYFGIVKTF